MGQFFAVQFYLKPIPHQYLKILNIMILLHDILGLFFPSSFLHN